MYVLASIGILAVALNAVVALPTDQQRIVGGSITTINQYPFSASLLMSWNGIDYFQICGGTIITSRSVLTATKCYLGASPSRCRVRVGSSWANSGGSVHNVSQIILHPNFNLYTGENDIAILRVASSFVYSSSVRAAAIASSNYILPDNQPVWAIGWGTTSEQGYPSEQIRHVQIWTVNQTVCTNRYAELGVYISDNMLCAGWLDVGGRSPCQGDVGSPLIHNNAIVGITSMGAGCGTARYPAVNTRVSRYTPWIQANA